MSGSITHIRPMSSGIIQVAKVVLAMPFGALATIGLTGVAISEFHLGFAGLGAFGFLSVFILLWQKPGKMPLAAISVALWIVSFPLLLIALSRWVPVWVSYLSGATFVALVAFFGVRIMIEWARQYYLSRASGGCRTIEWEWIYVGRETAHAHPLGRVSFGVFCVAAFLVLCWGWHVLYFLGQSYYPYLWIGLSVETVLLLLMLRLILVRHPAAYPLVFVLLGLNFPISLPFLFYWADGVRPNLIYRHRFERLVPPDKNSGELYAA